MPSVHVGSSPFSYVLVIEVEVTPGSSAFSATSEARFFHIPCHIFHLFLGAAMHRHVYVLALDVHTCVIHTNYYTDDKKPSPYEHLGANNAPICLTSKLQSSEHVDLLDAMQTFIFPPPPFFRFPDDSLAGLKHLILHKRFNHYGFIITLMTMYIMSPSKVCMF